MGEFLQIVELNYYNEAIGIGLKCYGIGTDKTRTTQKTLRFKCKKEISC